MKKINIFLTILFYLLVSNFCSFAGDGDQDNNIQWKLLSSSVDRSRLPAASGSGILIGYFGETFIMAGGMLHDEGGEKYSDTVYLLKKDRDGFSRFERASFKLKQKMAFAACFSEENRMIWAGGENEKGLLKKAAMLRWDGDKQDISQMDLPDLPLAVKNSAITIYNNVIYIAGGETEKGFTNLFLSLHLSETPLKWKELPSLPLQCNVPTINVQSNGEIPCLYLSAFPSVEGASENQNGIIAYYDFTTNKWRLIRTNNSFFTDRRPAKSVAFGGNYLLFTKYDVVNGISSSEREPDSLYLYNTITRKSADFEALPSIMPGGNFLFRDGDGLLLLNLTKDGNMDVWSGKPIIRSYFTLWDYLVVLSYLALTIIIGLRFSGEQVSTNQYFKGGGKVPTWAVGLSIIGAQLSAITFMSTPAKAYATNWNYFFLVVSVVFILPLVNRCFIPFYRTLNVTSAYEYLDKRFNYTIRVIASMAYILFELGRLSIILILPSLALAVVTGLNENLCVLIIGIITLMYTFKGGIKAVIWTDVMQVCVLLGGAFLCAVYILIKLPVDADTIYQNIQVNQKIRLMDLNFDLVSSNFWVVLVGGFTLNFLAFSTDQTTVQRYLTTKDEDSAKRSARIAAWLSVPAGIIFLCIGTLLYLFYYYHPSEVNIAQGSNDSIFPWYIVSQLPTGVRGLLIAGVFAAAMSSLGSSLASASTAFITDFYKIFIKDKSDRSYLNAAKGVTLAIGLLGIMIALYVINKGLISLWDQYNVFMSLFTGAIGGVFLLGIFTTKANSAGVIVGLVVSILFQYWVIVYTNLHFLLYAFIGLATCFIVGWLTSLCFPGGIKDISGLTIKDK